MAKRAPADTRIEARPATRFGRQISARVNDYAWAYRLRLSRMARRPDAAALRGPHGPAAPQGPAAVQPLRPILLLPGVYETWHFLEAVGRSLNAVGHPVHTVPEFGYNIRPIGEMAELAGRYIEAERLTNVAIVAHSKGGLIGKTLMVSDLGETRIASMVAINSPFAGSDYAHLVPIRTLREFVPTHETILNLARSAEVNARITSIFSVWDPIIPNGSALDGATNVELPITGHFRILDKQSLLDAVARAVTDS
jgi:triacylglycerol lipase